MSEITFLNLMGEITFLNKSATKSESLRTTMPYSIVKQFGLTEYDTLEWSIKAERGELIIQLKPIKTGRTELNDEDTKKVVIVYPKSLDSQKELAQSAFNHQQTAIQAKTEYQRYVEEAKEELAKSNRVVSGSNSPKKAISDDS
jgi:bifunctional DNA-binding transcriptional regulator/antitoxin component of YhaV-PrlF toxin-antitoxin module